jgi:hypothetical protein
MDQLRCPPLCLCSSLDSVNELSKPLERRNRIAKQRGAAKEAFEKYFPLSMKHIPLAPTN